MRATSSSQRTIRLRDVLPEAEFSGAGDICVTGCCTDLRRCRPGDLFVALDRKGVNGHRQVRRAVAAGATAVLVERPIECGVPFCLVRDTHDAWSRVCQALAGQPSDRLKVIGVAGGSGRTTTTYLIASVLEAGGLATGVLGALGYCDGVDSEPPAQAAIPALVSARWLSRMSANHCSHAVVEVTSAALRRACFAGVDLDAVCVTGGLGNKVAAAPSTDELQQSRLVELLRAEGIAILNADSPSCEALLGLLHGPALTVGVNASAEITATILEQTVSEQCFLLNVGEASVPVRTPLVGRRNVQHCLLSAAMGLAYERELTDIVRGLENVQRIPGRLERMECGQPFSAFVDCARSPGAVRTALREIRPLVGGRLIVVSGAEGDRRQAQRPWLGRVLENEADQVILTSDNPRDEDPSAIHSGILQGMRRREEAVCLLDRAEAIRHALSLAQAGDCVLVVGKGNEDCQIIGQQRIVWDDREVICECLYTQPRARPAWRISA